MSHQGGILSTLRGFVKTIFRKETPRELQEREDLYMSILSAMHRSLRQGSQSGTRLSGTETRKEVESLVDEACSKMQSVGVDTAPVVGLRFELQNILAPEVIRIFETFRDVDVGSSFPTLANGNVDVKVHSKVVDNKFRSILMEEYESVQKQLSEATSIESTLTSELASNASNPRPFFDMKSGALSTLMSSKGWLDAIGEDDPSGSSDAAHSDNFGYYPGNADDETNAAIRHYQMINLAKAAIIRERLGFSILSLKSTIPEAGRGVFVDGKVMAGSLLAFFPGQVWPKEYLSNIAFSTAVFKDDDNFHLSMRYDDILIDSRKAPYTVLNNANSNPFAIGHITNHPEKGVQPNCRTVMINFTDKMGLKSAGLDRYVPNTYAREPMLLGPKAMDRDTIAMHGFGLMASRDISNEELFYDYRLSPGKSYPSWYQPGDEELLKRRWWQDADTAQ